MFDDKMIAPCFHMPTYSTTYSLYHYKRLCQNDTCSAQARFKFMVLTSTELPHKDLLEHFDVIRVVHASA